MNITKPNDGMNKTYHSHINNCIQTQSVQENPKNLYISMKKLTLQIGFCAYDYYNKMERIFVGFGRIPIFCSQVMIENHIFTSGAARSGNTFFYDHE